jgi:hypothetical protein
MKFRHFHAVYGLLAGVLVFTSWVIPARAEWEQQTLRSKSGRPLLNMVTKGDLVMGQKFAGAMLYLQCFDGETLVMIYTVEPFFSVTPTTVRYWLDTTLQPQQQWLVSEGRNSVGIGLDPAKALMRSLVGHERFRVYIPLQDGSFGFATFSLGRIKPAVETVANKCGWQL